MSPTRIGWVGVAAYVVVVDTWLIRRGHPTLSAMAREHPAQTAVAAGLVTAHLLCVLRWDPLHAAARLITKGMA